MTKPRESLIIGAGVSGLVAARELASAGLSAIVADKARGVGGRMATRRLDSGACDSGAQFFTVKSAEFLPVVSAALDSGAAAPWCDGFPDGQGLRSAARHVRFRGAPGMTALPKWLAVGLDVRLSWKVRSVSFKDGVWSAVDDQGRTLSAGALFLSAPVPQSLGLLDAGGVRLPEGERTQLDACRYHPCFSLLARLSGPSAVPEPGGLYPFLREGHEPLAWIADNGRKGVSPDATTLTILGGREFSRSRFDAEPAAVEREMLSAAAPWLGSAVVETRLHRWRYSEPERPLTLPYLRSCGPAPLYFIGDAFGGSRVEGAALSGLLAARHFAASAA